MSAWISRLIVFLPVLRRHEACIRQALSVFVFVVFGSGTVLAGAADEVETDEADMITRTTFTRTGISGWQGATRRQPGTDADLPLKSVLTVRVYDGFERFRPYYGDDPTYGVDVAAEIETCPNGDSRISALDIGGWAFEVDGDCSSGRFQAWHGGKGKPVGAATRAEDTVLICDPQTWRCRIDDSAGRAKTPDVEDSSVD